MALVPRAPDEILPIDGTNKGPQWEIEKAWARYDRENKVNAAAKQARVAALEAAAAQLGEACEEEMIGLRLELMKLPNDLELKGQIASCLHVPAVYACVAAHAAASKEVEQENSPTAPSFTQQLKDDTTLHILLDHYMNSQPKNPAAEEAKESGGTSHTLQWGPPEARGWREMPQEELGERLNKGEIMPRDEWVPGVSENDRRKLTAAESVEHLAFGERIKDEGADALAKGDVEHAHLRFVQGVRLLEWVTSNDEEKAWDIKMLFVKMLRNLSLASLKKELYAEAKTTCDRVLELMDDFDGKSLYRRGMANIYLGNTKEAKNDFMKLIKSPFADDQEQAAGRMGLREIRKVVTKWQTSSRSTMKRSLQDSTFSFNREARSSKPSVQTPSVSSRGCHPVERKLLEAVGNTSAGKVASTSSSSTQETAIAPPSLSYEKAIDLMIDLIEATTETDVVEKIEKLQSLADYDERRMLIRLNSTLLPRIWKGILTEYGFTQDDFQGQKREAQRTIAYWRQQEAREEKEKVKENAPNENTEKAKETTSNEEQFTLTSMSKDLFRLLMKDCLCD